MNKIGRYEAPVAPRQVDTTATSTAAALVSSSTAFPFYSHWLCTEACYLVFGNADVAAASVANGIMVPANTEKLIEITKNSKYFRAVRVTNDGVLRWYVSGETV